jgi:hypothetical protein
MTGSKLKRNSLRADSVESPHVLGHPLLWRLLARTRKPTLLEKSSPLVALMRPSKWWMVEPMKVVIGIRRKADGVVAMNNLDAIISETNALARYEPRATATLARPGTALGGYG